MAKPLTKKYRNTEHCVDIITSNILHATTSINNKNKLSLPEVQNLLKRKLRKAYWIGYATGVNNFQTKIKNNKAKNLFLEKVDTFLKDMEIEDFKLIQRVYNEKK